MYSRQTVGSLCDPSKFADTSPISTSGASRDIQVTPWFLLATSIQRPTGNQFLQDPGSWSISGRISAKGTSMRILPSGTWKGNANCALSLLPRCAKSSPGPLLPGAGFIGARFLSRTLLNSTQSAPAVRRTLRTILLHPGAEDSIRSVATKGPPSSTVILTGPAFWSLDTSVPSRNKYSFPCSP